MTETEIKRIPDGGDETPTETEPQEDRMNGYVKKPAGRPRKRAGAGFHRYHLYSFSMEPSMIDALNARAEIEQVEGRSEIARRAIREYLRRAEKREKREDV